MEIGKGNKSPEVTYLVTGVDMHFCLNKQITTDIVYSMSTVNKQKGTHTHNQITPVPAWPWTC